MRSLPRLCAPLLMLLIIALPGQALAGVRQLGPDSGIAVGMLYPDTGALSAAGESATVAYTAALTDLNHYLSQNGYAQGIKLLLYDTASTVSGALTGLQEMDSLGVKLVIGPYSSSQSEALLPYANANDILLISPTATAPSLAGGDDNLLLLSLDDTYQALAIANLMWAQGRRAYLPVWRGDTWGDQLEDLVAADFAALGGTVLSGIRYDASASSYAGVAGQLDTLVSQAVATYGSGGVGVNLLSFDEGVSILADAASYSLLGQVGWYGSDGTSRNQSLLNNSRAASFAALTGFASPSLYESYETNTTPRQVLSDMVLRESLTSLLGGSTSPGTYQTWDAVWLAGLSYAASGSGASGSRLRQVVEDQASRYVGLSGVLQMDQNGDRIYGTYGFFKVNSSLSYEIMATYSEAYGSADGLKLVSPWQAPNLGTAPWDYTLGLLLAGSDSTAVANQSVLSGVQQAVNDINTHLALYGYPTQVKLVTYDTAGYASQAAIGVQSLADQGARTIIGPLTSAEASVALSTANSQGVTLLSPSSDASALSLAGDNLYRMVPDLQAQGRAMAQLMWQQGRRALTTIYRNDIWGQDLAQATARAFQALGGVVLGQSAYTANDNGSYNQALASASQYLQAAAGQYGKDQLAVQLSSMEEGASLLGQAGGYTGLSQAYWYGSESLTESTALVGTGAAARFASATNLTTVQYAINITGVVNGIPKSLPLTALSTQVQAAMGSTPQNYAYTAYDGAWMAVLAAIDANWTSSASALGAQLRRTAAGYTGLSNALALNANGDRNYANYDFLTPASGDWRVTYTYYTNPATGAAQLVSR